MRTHSSFGNRWDAGSRRDPGFCERACVRARKSRCAWISRGPPYRVPSLRACASLPAPAHKNKSAELSALAEPESQCTARQKLPMRREWQTRAGAERSCCAGREFGQRPPGRGRRTPLPPLAAFPSRDRESGAEGMRDPSAARLEHPPVAPGPGGLFVLN